MKITVKNYDDNKWDSMFYPDMRVLEVEHKGRKFELNTYGEIKLVYKDEIYYDLNEICSSEEELDNLYDELDVVHNNWYELRPIGEQYTKHIISGLYDDIFGAPTEITGELLDKYIKAEEE